MPLKDFFQKQFDMLEKFMITPGDVIRCVRIDPDLKEVFIKAMVKIEENPDNPHLTIPCDNPFHNTEQYFKDLLDRISKEYGKFASDLQKEGIRFTVPYNEDDKINYEQKFVLYASSLSESLPDTIGSIVFLLDPEEITNKEEFKYAVHFLATQTESKWVKYLVLEQRLDPLLEGLENEVEEVSAQVFYISPEDIANKAKEDIKNPFKLKPAEHRQYIGLLAGFAYGKKDYKEAGRLQQEWIALAEREGAPSEVANAYYNLGNTRLAETKYLEAEDCFCKAVEVCLDNDIDGLLPLAITNLGVTLHQQNRIPEAEQCFQTARENFKAMNQLPGEAYALDCLALMYQAEKMNAEAEASWLEALSIYKGITSDAFPDVRKSGSEEILDKLERFYISTGQEQKITDIKHLKEAKDNV